MCTNLLKTEEGNSNFKNKGKKSNPKQKTERTQNQALAMKIYCINYLKCQNFPMLQISFVVQYGCNDMLYLELTLWFMSPYT